MHLIVFLLTLIRIVICVNAALPVPPPARGRPRIVAEHMLTRAVGAHVITSRDCLESAFLEW